MDCISLGVWIVLQHYTVCMVSIFFSFCTHNYGHLKNCIGYHGFSHNGEFCMQLIILASAMESMDYAACCNTACQHACNSCTMECVIIIAAVISSKVAVNVLSMWMHALQLLVVACCDGNTRGVHVRYTGVHMQQ